MFFQYAPAVHLNTLSKIWGTLYFYQSAVTGLANAQQDANAAQQNFNQKLQAFNECMARTPGECKKCENGTIQNDDDEDPGECLKCENGEPKSDDSESCDLGGECTTYFCEGGSCIGYDDCGVCEECSNRVVP